jgi:hypothetical protein
VSIISGKNVVLVDSVNFALHEQITRINKYEPCLRSAMNVYFYVSTFMTMRATSFLFPISVQKTLELTQPSVQWVPGLFPAG